MDVNDVKKISLIMAHDFIFIGFFSSPHMVW